VRSLSRHTSYKEYTGSNKEDDKIGDMTEDDDVEAETGTETGTSPGTSASSSSTASTSSFTPTTSIATLTCPHFGYDKSSPLLASSLVELHHNGDHCVTNITEHDEYTGERRSQRVLTVRSVDRSGSISSTEEYFNHLKETGWEADFKAMWKMSCPPVFN
jgi:hypothetical protein